MPIRRTSTTTCTSLKPLFGSRLPVLDLGCGDGRQSRFLAGRFPEVIGGDISPSAVEAARTADDNPPNLRFVVVDARDTDQARRLHDDLGDTNVYLRGVLQALPPADRPAAAESIGVLVGTTGTLFVKELSAASATYFATIVGRQGPPAGLALVHDLGLTPGQVSEEDLETLFPADRFEMTTSTGHIRTTTRLATGERIAVPALCALVRPLSGRLSREASRRSRACAQG